MSQALGPSPHIPELFQDTPRVLNILGTIHPLKATVCRAYSPKSTLLGCKQMPGLGAYTAHWAPSCMISGPGSGRYPVSHSRVSLEAPRVAGRPASSLDSLMELV